MRFGTSRIISQEKCHRLLLFLETGQVYMKVLFLYPHFPADRFHYLAYPRGIGILSSIAREEGWQAGLLPLVTAGEGDEALEARFGEVRERIRRASPDLVAISLTSPFMKGVAALVERFREHDTIPVVVGGIGVRVDPERALAVPGVSDICEGEGEIYFRDLLRRSTVPGGGPAENRPRLDRCAVDLDVIPHPDRRVFDYRKRFSGYTRKVIGLEVMAGRGCPFRCTYCVHSFLEDAAVRMVKGTDYRCRSVGRVIEEVKGGLADSGVMPIVGFHDDCFGPDREWLEEFAARFPREIGLPFWGNCHPSMLTPWRVGLLERAGCVRLHVGVESGDERIRREVLGRDISDGRLEAGLRMVKESGIRLVTFNMIGIPGEDEEAIGKTIALNRRVDPFRVLVSLFRPYPGTALYRSCREKGLVEGSGSLSYYDNRAPLRNPLITEDRILFFFDNFVKLIYKR